MVMYVMSKKSLTYLLLSAVVLSFNLSYASGNVENFGFLVGEVHSSKSHFLPKMDTHNI